MSIKENTNNWEEIVKLLNKHEGTIADFCNLHNIRANQLYYYRKKFAKSEQTDFYPIALKSDALEKKETSETIDSLTDIKIEVGKATIHVPCNAYKSVLPAILKAIFETC